LDEAAAHFHWGVFLIRHRVSRMELEKAKASLWKAIEYFRASSKQMDSLRGLNAILQIMTLESDFKEEIEVMDTMKMIREDILAMRI
jgi:hypothetical protein